MTTFTKYEDFIPHIFDELPQCPDSVMLRGIQSGVRKFAMDTEVFRETRTLDVVSGQTQYTILPQSESQNMRFLSVKIEDSEVEFDVDSSLESITLKDTPVENITDGMVVITVIKPTENATTADPTILSQYSDAIKAVSKYILHKSWGKNWSSIERANFDLREYLSLINTLKVEKVNEYKRRTNFIGAGRNTIR